MKQPDPIVVVTEWTSIGGFLSIDIEDFIWAYIDAGYTKYEVMMLPEVRKYHQVIYRKRARKILARRAAFRKASYDWFCVKPKAKAFLEECKLDGPVGTETNMSLEASDLVCQTCQGEGELPITEEQAATVMQSIQFYMMLGIRPMNYWPCLDCNGGWDQPPKVKKVFPKLILV